MLEENEFSKAGAIMEPSYRVMCYVAVAALQRLFDRSRVQFILSAAFAFAVVASTADIASADEGGVSFWLPGFFGSLAATPQQPGWSLATIYYHTDVSASGNAALSKEITIGQFNPAVNASLNANVSGHGDLGIFAPS
jgi:hypothetical protein